MNWGRNVKPSLIDRITVLSMFVFSPIFVLLFYVVNYGNYNKSFGMFFYSVYLGDYESIIESLPSFELGVFAWCVYWIIFQLALAALPDCIHYILKCYRGGTQTGQLTPGSHVLIYNINGLQAWCITHAIFLMGYYVGNINPMAIIEKWGQILFSMVIISYSLAFLVYIKALFFSSHPKDNKITGHFIYDFVMGVEFNPRVMGIDLKLFFNGRPGIIGWTLINLIFMIAQYENFGYVTNSMILVNILQLIYVLDFFWNETWYLNTIDIAHDHFGWMLAFGDCVWLPFMYTLQAGYLMNVPVVLDQAYCITILVLGIFGYVIFRTANYQKDQFRKGCVIDAAKNDPSDLEYGKVKTDYAIGDKAVSIGETNRKSFSKNNHTKSNYIGCNYLVKSNTSSKHCYQESRLLISGLWGYARKMNYTGDIIIAACFCLACGFEHILPYFYSIYLTILLVNRCYRDEHRCKNKYGDDWDKYCRLVKYRLVPYVF